jgi:hypothetical protein
VVLEGILVYHRYGEMLRELARVCSDHHIFYLDVSFEETLRRHATKPIVNEVREHQLRAWYHERDVTGFPGETIVPEASSVEETVALIVRQSGLDQASGATDAGLPRPMPASS